MMDTAAMNLKNIRWDDLRFPAQAVNPVGQPSAPVWNQTHIGLEFQDAQTEVIQGVAQMPHTWNEGSVIYPHLHVCGLISSTNNVVWQYKFRVYNVNSAPGEFTTRTITHAMSSTQYKHEIVPLGEIDMTGLKISCLIDWEVRRLGTSTNPNDNYAGSVILKEYDIHYQVDSNGSRKQYIK